MRKLARYLLVAIVTTLATAQIATGTGPEDAPWALMAVPTGPSSVLLTWNGPVAPSGEIDEYRVYRDDGAGMGLVGTSGDTTYVDDTPVNDTGVQAVIYYVTAVVDGTESPPSNPALAPAVSESCLGIDQTDDPPTIYFDPMGCIPPL